MPAAKAATTTKAAKGGKASKTTRAAKTAKKAKAVRAKQVKRVKQAAQAKQANQAEEAAQSEEAEEEEESEQAEPATVKLSSQQYADIKATLQAYCSNQYSLTESQLQAEIKQLCMPNVSLGNAAWTWADAYIDAVDVGGGLSIPKVSCLVAN
ncbi:hypothetical protein BN14_09510 [Rhizoctonia solani AG-1 IB]|uniref:Uncharacterized protein n=1 Tax=Thanatephorus cucumeris (strain AG1-IB / isolate 7/3/14) TaxID=1108050 RepID=M5CG28_THACB|nr:hypothetical protein BN14_09510 [Rhizoctonia solani AG-1 IB]